MYAGVEADQTETLASPQGPVKRPIFPISVPVILATVEEASAASYRYDMPVVTGHVYVQAWYVAMFKAMQAGNVPLVVALWQMGLTTSVHARYGPGVIAGRGLCVIAGPGVACADGERPRGTWLMQGSLRRGNDPPRPWRMPCSCSKPPSMTRVRSSCDRLVLRQKVATCSARVMRSWPVWCRYATRPAFVSSQGLCADGESPGTLMLCPAGCRASWRRGEL